MLKVKTPENIYIHANKAIISSTSTTISKAIAIKEIKPVTHTKVSNATGNGAIYVKHLNIPSSRDFDKRFAGVDLEYYKSRIPPDQFKLLTDIIGILP